MDCKEVTKKWMRLTCVVFGIAFLGLSILLVYIGSLVDNAVFRYSAFIQSENFANTPRAAILMGVFLIGILWLQISGTVQEWAFIVFLNAALLGYLVIVGIFVLRFIESDEQRLSSQLYYGLLTTLKRYWEDSEFGTESRMAWTQLQLAKNCCGSNNYTDWMNVLPIPHEPIVPIACCKKTVAFCSDHVTFNATTDSYFIHVRGCFPEVMSDIPLSLLWQVILPFEIIGALSVFMSAYLSWEWRRRSRSSTRGNTRHDRTRARTQSSTRDFNPNSNQSLIEDLIT